MHSKARGKRSQMRQTLQINSNPEGEKSMPLKHRDYTRNGALSMVVLGLFLCGTVTAQDHSAHTQAKPATLTQGYGDLHHPVSTHNAQAQQFFDQGLRQ